MDLSSSTLRRSRRWRDARHHARHAEDAPWMASYTEARHTGFAGNVLWELGIHGQFVANTRNRLTAGIAARAEGRARTRDQIRPATLTQAGIGRT